VHMDSEGDAPPRVAGVNVTWIAALLILGAVAALLLISRARSDHPAALTTPSLPTMPAPISPPAPTQPQEPSKATPLPGNP
jgi:hypothetical protein